MVIANYQLVAAYQDRDTPALQGCFESTEAIGQSTDTHSERSTVGAVG